MDSMADPFTDLDINARAQLSILKFAEKLLHMFALYLHRRARSMGAHISTC